MMHKMDQCKKVTPWSVPKVQTFMFTEKLDEVTGMRIFFQVMAAHGYNRTLQQCCEKLKSRLLASEQPQRQEWVKP